MTPDLLPYLQAGVTTLSIVAMVATAFIAIGRKDHQQVRMGEDVAELRRLATETLKTQVAMATNQTHHQEQLRDLAKRVHRIETSSNERCGG